LQVSNDVNADPKTLRQWLTVIDTAALDTQIYCLSPNKPPTGGGSIVWSPSGTQLIVNTDTSSEEVKPILVNLKLLTQSKINTHGLWVTDWMAP
jgi:predicted amidohydrolase